MGLPCIQIRFNNRLTSSDMKRRLVSISAILGETLFTVAIVFEGAKATHDVEKDATSAITMLLSFILNVEDSFLNGWCKK